MKHVGKMKNNSARLAIAFRTLPGDPYHCLVVGTQGLGDSYHDTLMALIESDSAQQAYELGEILSARRFPDGTTMLAYLHSNGHLIKVKTSQVLMTPDAQTQIPLDQLNEIIAEQKGLTLDELAITENGAPKEGKKKPAKKVEKVVESKEQSSFEMTPAELRSRADALFKQAQQLRKQADELDPPKKKAKSKETV